RSDPETRSVKRHRSASYYAHRVKESLTTRVSKFICAIFLLILFFLGIIAFILWISLRPHRPRFHIQDFAIQGLDQPAGFENTQITFNVTIRNSNQHMGVYYDSMEGSVYYKDQRVGSSPLLYPFFQEPKNTTVVTQSLAGASLTVSSTRWTEFTNDRAQGSVAFRLEMVSVIRFKLSSWISKRHRMHANCNIVVGPDGVILPKFNHQRCPVYFT
ncbi:PREDICTED: protein YLS9, partial [Tarenaya hassleriana]|uniref:protein YLS9 n=1 Tax=Tarenaya hassleriana TaxID=28532 RepID=UPI00053C59C8